MFEQLESRQLMSTTVAVDAETAPTPGTTSIVADKKTKGSTTQTQQYYVVKLEQVLVTSYQ